MSVLTAIFGFFGLVLLAGLVLIMGVILFDLVLTIIHGENFLDF